MDYKPSKTCAKFMKSDALVKCIIGPLGSGKSMAGIFELFRRAVEQEPDAAGVRPTRFAVVRNTLAQLRETFLADAQSYLGDFFHYKVSRSALEFRFQLEDGTKVHSDWLLMPLERPEDSRKLLSLNLTGALVEECREVQYSVTAALMGRIGRYPSASRVQPTWQGIMFISNPWSEGSEYHENFVLDLPDGWDFFHQPGGLDPNAENVQYLPPRYYERLMDGHSDEWINVHVHSMFGDDQFGQAVYKASFKPKMHLVDSLNVNPHLPVLVGIDFGRTPACVFTQEDVHGRVLVFQEITSTDMGLRQFCERLFLPAIRDRYYQNRIFVVGDPAGVSKGQYSEESAYDVLKEFGMDCVPAPTNDPAQRFRAVEKNLLAIRAEEAGFLITAPDCPVLVRGFQRDYRYRKKRDGELTPMPEKNDASHVHDALQYACLGHQSNYVGRRVMIATRPAHVKRKPRFSPKAWT
jgi:hypothetical protein